MYSEIDIEGAVAAGALTPAAAAAFRRHVAQGRQEPAVDEEQFRLLTGFNDIFVSIAILLLLAALAGIGRQVTAALAPLAVAAAAWTLAEYFTRQRRMALPSIILLLAFVGGVAASLATVFVANAQGVGAWIESLSADKDVQAAIAGVIAAITAAAAWLHWGASACRSPSRLARWRSSGSRWR